MRRQKKRSAAALYTLCFLPVFALTRGIFALMGVLPVWDVDGILQHYPFFVCIGQWLREGLATGHFEAFSFALGQGQDALTALNYYGLGDPLTLLAALFSGAGCEAGFCLTLAVRIWCAGLAAAALARSLDMDETAAAAAGLIYVTLPGLLCRAETAQTIFVSPYIQFPLILCGIECAFRREKPWVLILGTAWSALCGFYFLYANLILALVYALIRQFTRGEAHPWRTLPGAFLRCLGRILLGMGIAAVTLLPAVMSLLGSQRAGSVFSLDGLRLFYPLKQLILFPRTALTGLLTSGAAQFVPALGLFAAGYALARGSKSARALIVTASAAALVPAVGYVLNGMAYETQRWYYALALLTALLTARYLPELLQSRSRRKTLAAAAGSALAMLYLIYIWKKGEHARLLLAAVFVIAAPAVFLLREQKTRKRAGCALLALELLAVFWAEAYSVSGSLLKTGEAADTLSESAWTVCETDARADVSLSALGSAVNGAAAAGVSGTCVYNSTLPSGLFRLMTEVCPVTAQNTNAILGLDARAALEALLGVDTYVTDSGDTRVPYGFAKASEQDGYTVYKSDAALPIAYLQTEVMSEADFAALSPLEKQWALLYRAVTDETEDVPETEVTRTLTEVPVTQVIVEGAEETENGLKVTPDTRITLFFDAPADCELYLEIDSYGETGTRMELTRRVYAEGEGGRAEALITGLDANLRADGTEDVTLNLGYCEGARTEETLSFSFSGEIAFSGFRLWAQPMSGLTERIETLKAAGMTDITRGDGFLSGTVESAAPAVLVTGIPYSEGWSVTVDGEAARPIASAGAFLAVEIPAGAHEIAFRYETPYLRAGLWISAASLLAFTGWMVIRKRRSIVYSNH